MQQIYEVWPSILPWKQNNITLLPSVSDNMSIKSIYFSKSLSICCKFPLLTSRISLLSNNTNFSNCISIVFKRMQSEILQLWFGISSIQILKRPKVVVSFCNLIPRSLCLQSIMGTQFFPGNTFQWAWC